MLFGQGPLAHLCTPGGFEVGRLLDWDFWGWVFFFIFLDWRLRHARALLLQPTTHSATSLACLPRSPLILSPKTPWASQGVGGFVPELCTIPGAMATMQLFSPGSSCRPGIIIMLQKRQVDKVALATDKDISPHLGILKVHNSNELCDN